MQSHQMSRRRERERENMKQRGTHRKGRGWKKSTVGGKEKEREREEHKALRPPALSPFTETEN